MKLIQICYTKLPYFLHAKTAPSVSGPPHYRGFTITRSYRNNTR